MKNTILKTFQTLFCMFFVLGCTKEKETITPVVTTETKTSDQLLFEKAKSLVDFTWFEKVDSLYKKSSGSGHGQAFFKTRFNAIAAIVLDSNGRMVDGNLFFEGSLIVKELYKDAQTLDLYAILYKDSKNVDADAKGWVWGYIRPDGNVAVSATKKGISCISCHSQTGNIDYVLMNKFY
jgi:hypothetical protein